MAVSGRLTRVGEITRKCMMSWAEDHGKGLKVYLKKSAVASAVIATSPTCVALIHTLMSTFGSFTSMSRKPRWGSPATVTLITRSEKWLCINYVNRCQNLWIEIGNINISPPLHWFGHIQPRSNRLIQPLYFNTSVTLDLSSILQTTFTAMCSAAHHFFWWFSAH